MNKFLNFIKYHNAFSISISAILAISGVSLAASPEIRQDVTAALVSQRESVRSVDNARLLAADLERFNPALQIKEIAQDEDNYYIRYTFRTLAIGDSVWQEVRPEKTLKVSKKAIEGKDLGLYIAEELGEVIDYELSYLKEVKTTEQKKGRSQKVVAIEYAGLIGKFLNPEEKVFPGYEPVVKPPPPPEPEPTPQPEPAATQPIAPSSPEPTPQSAIQPSPPPPTEPVFDRETVRLMIKEAVDEWLKNNTPPAEPEATSATAPPPAPEPEPTSTEPPPTEPPPTEPPAAEPETAATSTVASETSAETIATTTEEIPVTASATTSETTAAPQIIESPPPSNAATTTEP